MEDAYSEILVNRISSLCQKRGITIYQLAKMSGVSHSTLDNIVNRNTVNPRIKTLHRIATAFSLTVAELLDFDELNNCAKRCATSRCWQQRRKVPCGCTCKSRKDHRKLKSQNQGWNSPAVLNQCRSGLSNRRQYAGWYSTVRWPSANGRGARAWWSRSLKT